MAQRQGLCLQGADCCNTGRMYTQQQGSHAISQSGSKVNNNHVMMGKKLQHTWQSSSTSGASCRGAAERMLASHSCTSSSRSRPAAGRTHPFINSRLHQQCWLMDSHSCASSSLTGAHTGAFCSDCEACSPATQGITRSSRRSGMARRMRHTMCRCCAMHTLRISTGSTSAGGQKGIRWEGVEKHGSLRHVSRFTHWCIHHGPAVAHPRQAL